jgi:hypothetical protein
MLNQLKIQTEYREKMADNLEHEMRTPPGRHLRFT